MARVIVVPTAKDRAMEIAGPVLMDEEVDPVQLGDGYWSLQLIQQLARAIHDAEEGIER